MHIAQLDNKSWELADNLEHIELVSQESPLTCAARAGLSSYYKVIYVTQSTHCFPLGRGFKHKNPQIFNAKGPQNLIKNNDDKQ